jgi:hypothetical protein
VIAASVTDAAYELRTIPQGRLIATLIPPGPLKMNHCVCSPDGERLYMLTDTRQIMEWDPGKLREEWARLGVPDDVP